jgi:hypothetical protein
MGNFLQRLFTKSDVQKEADFRNNLQALIHSYGEVMERKETISDIDSLPAPKQMMKKLLLEAIKIYPPGEQREFLKGGYVMLSSFQPVSEAQKSALREYNLIISAPVDGAAQEALREEARKMAGLMELIMPLLHASSAEAATLLAELRAVGV